MGIQDSTDTLTPLDELVNYSILSVDSEKEAFKSLQNAVWNAIKVEVEATGESWQEANFWFIDRMVYTFLNRLFAIRVMESLELLKESTLVPQADLGNRSARMARIQEQNPGKTMFEWWQLVLRDAFGEIGKDVRILFDQVDIASRIWPEGQVIEQLVQQLNAVNPDIYQAPDIIGWFYHYYVLKIRKGHKTMSSHGSKSPANPNYLSILNTVYTPRWMVRVLVDNSLGHWWQDAHPDSHIFWDSPFFIRKVPVQLETPTDSITNLRILDPACGSGNFLVYTFEKLVEIYRETFPDWTYSKIMENILGNNLFGIDINRRPAQLSALALYISAKSIVKTKSPAELAKFKMPIVNILCCDIRIPHDKNRVLFIQQFKDARIQKVMKDVIEQFDNADQLGSLIDIQTMQTEINRIKQEMSAESKKQRKIDAFLPNGKKKAVKEEKDLDLVSYIESEGLSGQQINIGMQLFGLQAKNAATLAQALLQKYDIIMGNPPFGYPMDATKKKLRQYYPNTYADLVSTFIDQSYRLLNDNGYISMVTDFSFMHLPKFENFREHILLCKLYIEYLLVTGLGALPDARNVPVLFTLRKTYSKEMKEGFYRYVEYSSSQQFVMDVYTSDILNAIKAINSWSRDSNLPRGWNCINQAEFLALPRHVIDLSIADKFKPLLEFFVKFPRLDIAQHRTDEKTYLSKLVISQAFFGFNTGNNHEFVRYWFENTPNSIRRASPINTTNMLPSAKNAIFVPFSKGGGDLRYYNSNGYILWWDYNSAQKMSTWKGHAFRNINLIGIMEIICSLMSGKPRGRFCYAQKGILCEGNSTCIKIQESQLPVSCLLAYLNSKFTTFFLRLQTKSRRWDVGNLARIPIPFNFLISEQNEISIRIKETFGLRRDWDTGYPMSPIFAESLIDKVIKDDPTNLKQGILKTGHPFCEEYEPCNSIHARKINAIQVERKNLTIKLLLDAVEERFNILIRRLDEIDEDIDKLLYKGLLDEKTAKALDEYYEIFVGKLDWQAERDIWLKDFIMSQLIDIINGDSRGIISLDPIKTDETGLYFRFINLLCIKFDKNLQSIQFILKELEELLGMNLRQWIEEDFFYYHCQRFGGRPIIWQFSSRPKSSKENAINLFIDYHKLTENTLPNIRVEYVDPLIRSFDQRKSIGMLPKEEIPRIDELEEFSRAFLVLETGYQTIPNPNALTGNKSQKGKGDDKTWEWVFGEAAKIIRNGYKPDHFFGVLVNILPLCLDLPETRQKDFPIKYQAICPKGTLKKVLKKLDALDQLRNIGSKVEGEEEDNEGDDQGEGKKKRGKKQATDEESESNEEEANSEDHAGEDA